MDGLRFLLVEDDEQWVAAVRRGLALHGHMVDHLADCSGVVEQVHKGSYDAMILDRLLPDGDAVRLIAGWREQGVTLPVLVLTGADALHDRVDGLNDGADDYLTKPFETIELEARLRALVRRTRAADTTVTSLSCGSIEIDRLRREVRRHGQRVFLQPRELRLLEELALQPGEVVTRAMLLQSVWSLQFDPRTKLIESQISRLREKLNAGGAVDPIETVRGEGYRLRPDV